MNAMRCKSQAPFLSSKAEVVRCESNEQMQIFASLFVIFIQAQTHPPNCSQQDSLEMGGRSRQLAAGQMCPLLAGRHQCESGPRSRWRWIALACKQYQHWALQPGGSEPQRKAASHIFAHALHVYLLLIHFIRLGPHTMELLPATHLILITFVYQPVCLAPCSVVVSGALPEMSCSWWLRLANVIRDRYKWFWNTRLFRHNLLQRLAHIGTQINSCMVFCRGKTGPHLCMRLKQNAKYFSKALLGIRLYAKGIPTRRGRCFDTLWWMLPDLSFSKLLPVSNRQPGLLTQASLCSANMTANSISKTYLVHAGSGLTAEDLTMCPYRPCQIFCTDDRQTIQYHKGQKAAKHSRQTCPSSTSGCSTGI